MVERRGEGWRQLLEKNMRLSSLNFGKRGGCFRFGVCEVLRDLLLQCML